MSAAAYFSSSGSALGADLFVLNELTGEAVIAAKRINSKAAAAGLCGGLSVVSLVLSMPDRVILSGIRFRGRHGVSAEERATGGSYSVDVEMTCDLSAAIASDSVHDTVDYSAVHRLVMQLGRERSFHLLETLAGHIAESILARFPVESVTVRIRKLHPPLDGIVEYAGVEITRHKSKCSKG
jgi:dihydroneopterin aldolase